MHNTPAHYQHSSPMSNQQASEKGFSIIELAIVLVLIGLVIGVAAASWRSFMDARQIAKAQSTLFQVRNCLIQQLTINEWYPRTTAGLTCSAPGNFEVDACLCDGNMTDAWGNPIHFIAGLNATNTSLATSTARLFITTDEPRGQIRTSPGNNSTATDHNGATVNNIAFILISYGENGQPDSATYDTGTALAGSITPGAAPDFSANVDDVYLITTSYELAKLLRN